jgi:hypothetical protein
MNPTVAESKDTKSSIHYRLDFTFPKGKTQPSPISKLPRQEIYRFGVGELIGWLNLSEEDAVIVIDDLLEEIDDGAPIVKHVFPNGETFSISSTTKK